MEILRDQYVDAPFDEVLVKLCTARQDVMILSADLARYTDVITPPRKFPNQFLQVGMAEQNLLGIAGGLAKSGFLPIATTFAVYATRRAFDQLAMCMASGPSNRGIVVGFTPGILNPAKVHHQALEDLAMTRALPGVCVIDPIDATEFAAAVLAAADHPGLVYMRGHRGRVIRLFDPAGLEFRIGATRVLRQGEGVGIVGTGAGSQWALEASEILAQQKIPHAILHVPTLKPVRRDEIVEFCAGRPAIVSIENHQINGGLGSLVAEVIAEEGIGCRLRRLGVPDQWAPGGTLPYIRREVGLDAARIAAHVQEMSR